MCGGGGGDGGPQVLDKLLDYSNPLVAPTRLDSTLHLLAKGDSQNSKPNDNTLDVEVWLKSNDQDRSVQEFHGRVTLVLGTKPTTNQTINLGFYFGQNATLTKKPITYGPPSTFSGSYASFAYNAASPAASVATSKQVGFSSPAFDTYANKVSGLPLVAGASDYWLQATGTPINCPTTGGCTVTYEFMRTFSATSVAITKAQLNQYTFYGFYELSSGDKGFSTKPQTLLMGAFGGLYAASVAVAALVLVSF